MSEMKDSFIYNFYDYVKSIYIYSHIKTNLKDVKKQPLEEGINLALQYISISFLVVSIFKIFVIIFYFIFIQAFSGFIKFILSIFKTKGQLNYCSSFKNAFSYLAKVGKRIYTFNFYLFHNLYIGFIMIFGYFLYLLSSIIFYLQNIKYLEDIEKPETYLDSFYCHFESSILIQLLCSSFYACRDMKISTYISLGLFLIMNAILFLGYFITQTIENADGIFEYDQPQCFMNIIFNTILLFLNGISLYNVIIYKGNGKYIYYNIYL